MNPTAAPTDTSPALQTLHRLYTAFEALDAEGMQACYADEAAFEDPIFRLQGRAQIGAMWGMLCRATKSQVQRHGAAAWALQASRLQVQGDRGSAHWEVQYRFPATGRGVHNRVDAQFRFDAQGLILHHHDHFDFWAWSRQALGAPGWLLGWTPWLRQKVRRQGAQGLRRADTSGG